MKKIALSLSIVVVAIFAFFYVQLQQAKSLLLEQLAQHDISVKSLKVGLIPQPHFSIEQLNYHTFSLTQTKGKVAFLPLFAGDVKLEELTIAQAKLTQNATNSAQIMMRFANISLNKLFTKEILFSGANLISVELAKPIYGKTTKYTFTFNKASLALHQDRESLLQIDGAKLNEQALDYIEIHADFSKPQKVLIGYIKPICTTNCLAVLKFNGIAQQSTVNFSGKNFPTERLLTLLNLPKALTGTTDFNIRLAFNNSELIQGTFDFNARDGEILGMNLLDLATQYWPINYRDDLSKRRMSTAFERLDSQLSLDNNLLRVNKFNLITPELLGRGNGLINLHTMQCDAILNLSSTDEKYKDFTLPIRFFDSCYSPQYKIEFNKFFRKQLKDLLKEKLN
ncbi:putative assembly protein [Stutzerimonas stutzeri]|nr:putative assembly protein [Stutzerimonas stutzeri]